MLKSGFERQLTLTGGKLNLEKTKFYHLVPKICGTRLRFREKRGSTVRLEVMENFSNIWTPLKQLDPTEPYKMLGILTEPADLNRDQVTQMSQIAKNWNSRMLGSALTNR